MKAIIASIIASMMFLSSCTDESSSRQALQSAGYTDITFTGYSVFTCGQEDNFATGFQAKNPAGQMTTGTVCCGLFKGCTIRF